MSIFGYMNFFSQPPTPTVYLHRIEHFEYDMAHESPVLAATSRARQSRPELLA
jgi:hypothetical protein